MAEMFAKILVMTYRINRLNYGVVMSRIAEIAILELCQLWLTKNCQLASLKHSYVTVQTGSARVRALNSSPAPSIALMDDVRKTRFTNA
jgi:hypothetical protein